MKFHYRLCWWLLRGIFGIYFRWRIIGADRIPMDGPVILASNHVSFLDPPLIGSSVPREASFLARESLFQIPLLGTLIRSINALPVDREGKSPRGLKAILDRLAEGEPVVLFPEGTRTNDGSLQAARSGVGLAVVKSGAPVVPIRIFGAYEAYSRKMRFPRPRKITIVYGEPMDFTADVATAKTEGKTQLKQLYPSVAKRIMEQIGSLRKDGTSQIPEKSDPSEN